MKASSDQPASFRFWPDSKGSAKRFLLVLVICITPGALLMIVTHDASLYIAATLVLPIDLFIAKPLTDPRALITDDTLTLWPRGKLSAPAEHALSEVHEVTATPPTMYGDVTIQAELDKTFVTLLRVFVVKPPQRERLIRFVDELNTRIQRQGVA